MMGIHSLLQVFLVLTMSAPLLKDQTYQIQVKSCSGEEMIVQTQNSTYAISLFNVEILTKEGLDYSCERVTSATRIEMKIDRYATAVDKITAWIYVDDDILQKELVEQGYARMRIKNPEYGHHEQMMEAAVYANANLPEHPYHARAFDRKRGNVFLLVNVSGLFICCVIVLLIQTVKKRRNL